MPLIESQPDALAEIYATSLFELAEAKGGREAIEDVLGELQSILELARQDGKFNEFLASRTLGVEARRRSLKAIFDGKISPLTLQFLMLLNDKDRLSHLHPIVAAYDKLVQAKFGRVEVDVYSAQPISTDDLAKVKDRFQKATGKEAIIHPYTDESMIGGVKLRIGDKLIDASLALRMRRLKDQLAESGAASIRARVGEIIEGSGD